MWWDFCPNQEEMKAMSGKLYIKYELWIVVFVSVWEYGEIVCFSSEKGNADIMGLLVNENVVSECTLMIGERKE